jgi:hypothetical protein
VIRGRLGLLVAATALSVAALGAGGAEAAKVTETAQGGTLPAATGPVPPRVWGEFRQEFELKGKKVKGRQILDIDLTVNATGGSPDALQDVFATLIGPKGDRLNLRTPNIGAPSGQFWVDVRFDEQSILRSCDPTFRVRSDCNYLQGDTTYTGPFRETFRRTFGGGNPKGTWTLIWQDTGGPNPVSAIGASTLQVKTGKRFEKD